jgi:hypothetical protein
MPRLRLYSDPPRGSLAGPVGVCLAAHAIGLAAVGWHLDGLRTWALEGPWVAPAVRVPLLAAAAVAAEFVLLTASAPVGRLAARLAAPSRPADPAEAPAVRPRRRAA